MTTLIPKYDQGNTGAVNRAFNIKLNESVSVLDFGADSTGTTDSSTAISEAIATGKAVYFPSGTYACNISINNKTILFGDGSEISIIKPYSYSTPAMIYTFAAQQNPVYGYWNYHTEVRNLGFQGTGSGATANGIGFSLGGANGTSYTANAEYANNVTFYNCFFSKLQKGVQFPFGNIGTAFYSCGFQANYYGVYMLDNKSGSGDPMHAGNKYFYNGEFDGNICAVYLNNATQGLGGVAFNDVIFEANNIAVYYYDSVYGSYELPVQFKNCWNEQDGTVGGNTTAVIDLWTGDTVTTQTVNSYPFIFYTGQVLMEGGFVTGINLTSDQSQVYVKGSHVEIVSGYGGQNMAVTYPNSRIYFEDCKSNSGFAAGVPQAICKGINYAQIPTVGPAYLAAQGARAKNLPLAYAINSAPGIPGNYATLTTAAAYTGASSGTGTQVSDGVKYATCNEFTYNFTATSQYIWPTATVTSVSNGWWAYTIDVKVTAGSPQFLIGDLSNYQFGKFVIPADSEWHTVGGVGYFTGSASIFMATGGIVSNCTWRMSAFQLYNFSTQGDAEEFLASRTYLG